MKNFYLSQVIHHNLRNTNGEVIGKVTDLVVDASLDRPKVVAAKIKSGKKSRYVDLKDHSIISEKDKVKITCPSDADFDISSIHALFLVKNILDKQVVDISDRKVVRVNDLRLINIQSGTYLLAVDVGWEGLLRRLGIDKPVETMLKPFKGNIPSEFILWKEVEAINYKGYGIQLSKPYKKLSTLHPSDLADILEELDSKSLLEVFSSLDEEQAADVLEEMEPEVQQDVLKSLSVEKAADLLEKMPADEAADILDDIRELMEYPEHHVGSLMSTDFIAFQPTGTVAETIAELRKLKPEANTIYSMYILDKDERLVASFSLRDLVISESNTKLSDIMNTHVIYVYDDDKINSLSEIISKYNLSSIPVVDHEHKMVGMVIIDDVVFNLLSRIRRR
jgi:CBS domain-containing protein/sporulation protein YlmC with PRC-barrel domain